MPIIGLGGIDPPAPPTVTRLRGLPLSPVPGVAMADGNRTRPSPSARPDITITMKVTSEKKAAAARANGALSHGPVTPEGKARSSQNALQHGLFSTAVVLQFEDPEEFRALLNDYCDYYQP